MVQANECCTRKETLRFMLPPPSRELKRGNLKQDIPPTICTPFLLVLLHVSQIQPPPIQRHNPHSQQLIRQLFSTSIHEYNGSRSVEGDVVSCFGEDGADCVGCGFGDGGCSVELKIAEGRIDVAVVRSEISDGTL